MAEQPQRPHGHRGVHHAEQQAGADHAQLRHEDQRERDRHGERAQVVEGQHLRHEVLEHDVALEDAHHQRNLEPHQRAHHHHEAVQQQPERARHVGVGQEQDRRQRAADQRHEQFDAKEVRRQLPVEVAREPRADAHGEQVGADDGAELQHRVAEQVGAQRGCAQFIDEAAGRDDEHAGEQRDLHGLRPPRIRGARGQGRVAQWIAAATMTLMPRHMAATTSASALFCFSTISPHRS
ncbi:hypothetical protein D3C72_955970 [compost metagenome]